MSPIENCCFGIGSLIALRCFWLGDVRPLELINRGWYIKICLGSWEEGICTCSVNFISFNASISPDNIPLSDLIMRCMRMVMEYRSSAN